MAIRGERYDGHAFIPEAVRKGASAVVVERRVAVPPNVRVIQVPDSVEYMAKQASRRLAASGSTVIAITGSIGKTSTKNAIATVLDGQFPVLSTPGNLNTVQGIAQTLLNSTLGPSTKVVLEMGACRVGDIEELCGYFPPDLALVTNVHGVHLETFGTIEDVARAKGEIVEALGMGGTACLNADDPRVDAMAARCQGNVIRYGARAASDVMPHHITTRIPLLGEHTIYLALAAYATGHVLGMTGEDINQRLGLLQTENGRLSLLAGIRGCTLIDDSYNASPASTRAALRVLQTQPAARRMAVLGDMLELGAQSHVEHVEIIRCALGVADGLIVVGQLMGQARLSLLPEEARNVIHVPTSALAASELAKQVPGSVTKGDVVLVKGSQGVRMEHVSRALLHPDIAPESVLCRQSASWRQI